MRQPDPDPLPVTPPFGVENPALRVRRSPDLQEPHLPRGLDFALADALGLSRHPALRAAAARALTTPAPFASGVGATETEDQLARLCHMSQALTFASGTEAILATMGHLLRPGDTVIVDIGLPPAFAMAARAARARICFSPTGLVEAVERRLIRLSRQHRPGRVFICVPAVSALGSVLADLRELVPLAAAHGATLIVDISHDLGAIGLLGQGLAETQGQLGQCDVLLGSLTGTFGVAAGMAASRDPSLLAAMQPCGLPPVLAAALSEALALVRAEEGHLRRRRLRGNGLRLRNQLMAEGLRLMGQPSPIVPIPLPPGREVRMSALLASAGPVVPLITAPMVGRHSPRWLVRLSADHSSADIDNLAELMVEVSRALRLMP